MVCRPLRESDKGCGNSPQKNVQTEQFCVQLHSTADACNPFVLPRQ